MSQRVTKCTVCAENGHTRLHCMNICPTCSSDKRDCGCEPPRKRPAKDVQKKSGKNYKKEFDQLLLKYEKVSAAYRAMKEQEATWPHEKRALIAQLEALKEDQAEVSELEEDNQELVRLNKEKQRQVDALNEEVERLKDTVREKEQQIDELRAARGQPPAQAQPKRDRVGRNDLSKIHERYQAVAEVMRNEGCTIRNAFRLSGHPRSTVRDLVGIAELKIVDQELYNVTLREVGRDASVKAIERACRQKLARLRGEMAILRVNGRLLPFSFEDSFFE